MTDKPDIVERLRDASRRVVNNVFNTGDDRSLMSIPVDTTRDVDVILVDAADEIERLRGERERINVAVTRRIHGYKSDDPIWYTVDHIAAVLEKVD